MIYHVTQQFGLHEVKPLWSMVILEDRAKSKDHMAVVKGERVDVILITHEKLPQHKLLVEKDDGMSECMMCCDSG